MKTIASALLVLGFLATSASAEYCPPGKYYGPQHRPLQTRIQAPIRQPVPPPAAIAPDLPAQPPVDPVPQK